LNGPLFAAFFISIVALWVVLMALPGIGHPPIFPKKEDPPKEDEISEKEGEPAAHDEKSKDSSRRPSP